MLLKRFLSMLMAGVLALMILPNTAVGYTKWTHGTFAQRVVDVLRTDGYDDLALELEANLASFTEGLPEPDEDEFKLLYGYSRLNLDHFHDPWSHQGNIRDAQGPTRPGGEIAAQLFDRAVTAWRNGNRDTAMQHLGQSLHFLQDATVPNHTDSNFEQIFYHSDYETYGGLFLAIGGAGGLPRGIYSLDPGQEPRVYGDHCANSWDPFDWVDYAAHTSRVDYDAHVRDKTYPQWSTDDIREVFPRLYDLATQLSAGYVKLFFDTVNYGDSAKTVLAIDSSGSMSWNDPQRLRVQAAKFFIDRAQPGDYIGLVDFNGTATVLAEPMLVETQEDRDQLKALVERIGASGGTNIGAAIQRSGELLDSLGPISNASVILLTDGDGTYSNEAAAYPLGRRVFAIGLGSSYNFSLLFDIATATGGKTYHAADSVALRGIFDDISSMIHGANVITTKGDFLLPGEQTILVASADASRQRLSSIATWEGSDFDLMLIDPNGDVVDPETDHSVSRIEGATWEIVTVDNAMPGEWTFICTAVDVPPDGQYVEVRVEATSMPPVINRATFAVKPSTINLGSNGRWVSVLAEVPDGFTPADLIDGDLRLMAVPSSGVSAVGDFDGDGDVEVMLKFPRDALQEWLIPGEVIPLTLSGTIGAENLVSTGSVRVIAPPHRDVYSEF